MRDQKLVELDPQFALEMVEIGMANENHLAMICAHADLVRRMVNKGPERIQADTIIRIGSEIMDRPEFAILSGEKAAIIAAMSVTLPVVQRAGNMAIHKASEAMNRDFDRNGGIRVQL